MRVRGDAGPAAESARNRCRCGHYPTAHMKVLPISDRTAGSFRLDWVGPCAVCGDTSCRRFTPSV